MFMKNSMDLENDSARLSRSKLIPSIGFIICVAYHSAVGKPLVSGCEITQVAL